MATFTTFYAPDTVPLRSLCHISDMMLVWRKESIKTVSVIQYRVPLEWCTKLQAVLTGRSTVLGFFLILLCLALLSFKRL